MLQDCLRISTVYNVFYAEKQWHEHIMIISTNSSRTTPRQVPRVTPREAGMVGAAGAGPVQLLTVA